MSDAKVTFAGDAASLLAEHKKIEEAKSKEIAGLKALLAESKKTYGEEQKHLREKQTALDKTRTAQQVYNDQMQKWFNLMANGKMTLAEFNRLKGVEKKALDDNTAAVKREADAVVKAVKAKRDDHAASLDAADGNNLLGGAFNVVTAAVAAATAGLKAFAEERKRMQSEVAADVKSVDDLSREYAVQGGLLTDEQRVTARDKIMNVAQENAATSQQAFSTASQLASSGFKDAEGETLDSALKILATSDMAKADPKVYIDGAARFLKASNMELNGKNLMAIGVAMRGIVDTPVQASDLAEFSEAAPILNMQGVDWKTGLGMMTELRKAYSGAQSGTKMRNIGQRLAQAGGDTQAMEALDALGLKPEDIDAIGETMPEALRRIGKAVDSQPIDKRATLMGKLFNNENVAAADVLIKNIDNVDKNVAAMGNTEVFTSGVGFALSGTSADERRGDIRSKQDALKNEDKIRRREWITRKEDEAYTDQWNRVDNNKNLTGGEKAAVKAMLFSKRKAMQTSDLMFEKEDYYGDAAPVNAAIDASMNRSMSSDDLNRRLNPDAKPAADPQAAAMAEQNALLRNIAGNQQRQADAVTNPASKPIVNPNAVGRPDR